MGAGGWADMAIARFSPLALRLRLSADLLWAACCDGAKRPRRRDQEVLGTFIVQRSYIALTPALSVEQLITVCHGPTASCAR